MQFGVQFFPAVDHTDKSAADYYAESLAIAEEADRLGFSHARTVEHYFTRYGGYSPNPIVFLSAVSQRTQDDAARHRRGAAGVQPSVQARRRDRDARRHFRRAARRRLRARVPAARVPPLRHLARRIAGALPRGPRADRAPAHAGECQPSRPVPCLRERDLAAAPDADAAPKFYIAATQTPKSFEFAGQQGLLADGDPDRADRRR